MLEFVPPGHVIGSGRASICAFVSPMKDTTQLIAHRLLRHHAVLALALALIMTGVSWRWNTRAASGSDAYGYVSEAELWLRGDLQIDQRFAARFHGLKVTIRSPRLGIDRPRTVTTSCRPIRPACR